jgi:hypothetical protein
VDESRLWEIPALAQSGIALNVLAGLMDKPPPWQCAVGVKRFRHSHLELANNPFDFLDAICGRVSKRNSMTHFE